MWNSIDDSITNVEIRDSVDRLFENNHTGAVAVFDQYPWIFTAYLAKDKNFLWFTSQEKTSHTTIIQKREEVAVSLWRSPKKQGDPLFGVQLKGKAKIIQDEVNAEIGLHVLHNRFANTIESLPNKSSIIGDKKKTCLFKIELYGGYLRDEEKFGKGKHEISWINEV